MHLSTHYYVLSLSEQANKLFECFRHTVIEVENQGFPVLASAVPGVVDEDDDGLRDMMRTVDRLFARYYREDPLRLIVVGEKRVRAVFESVTAYRNIIMGGVDGDHTGTSPDVLGQIVWPIVKQGMSGANDMALRDLEVAEKTQTLVFGLEAVGRHSDTEVGSTLLVEEDYHVKGTMKKTDQAVVVSPDIDVREVMDDVVDTIIERVLEIGGSVVFMATGSLKSQQRIALIRSGLEEA